MQNKFEQDTIKTNAKAEDAEADDAELQFSPPF